MIFQFIMLLGGKPFDFCKVLIDEFPESLRNTEDSSLLPYPLSLLLGFLWQSTTQN